MAEHTADGGGGLAYTDQRAFSAAVTALQEPGARERLGAAGRAYVEQRFSWDEVRSRFRAAVEELACAS
jgi:glycosyltransferase involved in cell wall biosynthesis